ncbi:MAG: 4Fe-4S binding protein [Deltaproteobacteria bacterium]|nr:4Fe-4S binding protein [Deltaproteobacteria bacterium]
MNNRYYCTWPIILGLLAGLMIIGTTTAPAADQAFAPLAIDGINDSAVTGGEKPVLGAIESEDINSKTGERIGSEYFPVKKFRFALIALMMTILAGILVRLRRARFLRRFMLLSSLAFFGFANGSCPCIISGFQSFILTIMGISVIKDGLILFIAIVVATIFFGRVWCGWVCHLGALQEFLFRSGQIPFMVDRQVLQRILRWTRYAALVVLLVQLYVTKSNLFKTVDPFRAAFNFSSSTSAGWIALAILLIASILMYRPFCRGICPVGAVLGLMASLPVVLRIKISKDCSACRRCSSVCDPGAIDETGSIASDNCLLCGNCLDSCGRKCYSLTR